MTFLDGRDLGKRYSTGVVALRGVDVTLNQGGSLGIVGESGSGKSTLGRILLRLEKPTTGSLQVGEVDPWRLRGRALRRWRRTVQLVPQDPRHAFNPRLTLGESILSHMAGAGVQRGERVARMLDLVSEVGMAGNHLSLYPGQLSGGQVQRLAIARALASRPEVLVCDEAVSALDKSVQAQILNLLTRVQDSTGVALVFISHDIDVVHHMTDDVLVLRHGRVMERGPTAEVWQSPQNDYTRDLLIAAGQIPAAT